MLILANDCWAVAERVLEIYSRAFFVIDNKDLETQKNRPVLAYRTALHRFSLPDTLERYTYTPSQIIPFQEHLARGVFFIQGFRF